MVGAQKSNRCDTCRQRKVKCDEAWPVCGQCKVKNRVCPARPALKFVDESSKIPRHLPSANHVGVTRQKTTKNTGSRPEAHKNHDILDFVPLAPSEKLSLSFIDAVQVKNPRFNLRILGEFVWEVPQYLGNSEPLDNAIACVLESQHQLAVDANHGQTVNRRLYGRALQSLRAALVAPESWRSTATLAATVMMHRIGALFIPLPNSNVQVHAAGLAALHEKRGPPDPSDKLALQATVDSQLSIIQDAVSQRKESFLTSDAWSAALDTPTNRSPVQSVYYRLMRLMALWPTLVLKNCQVQAGDPATSPKEALVTARHVLDKLSILGRDMSKVVWRQGKLSLAPSVRRIKGVEADIQVADPLAAMLFCHFATYSVIVCRITLSIIRKATFDRVFAEKLDHMIQTHCRHIWMLLEYSCSTMPLGLPIMPAALLVTYEPTKNAATRLQILAALNELQRAEAGNIPWSPERIRANTDLLLGG